MAGRRGRCAACDAAFIVPPPPDQTPRDRPSAHPGRPQFVSVDCRVCGTRLTGRIENVGKKIKCPDCGAGTVLPDPPAPKPKNMPAALEGEQYELWDADDQPLASELIASQPKYITILCSKCGTLLNAPESQAGQRIKCPDCGALEMVNRPPKVVPKRSVIVPNSETPPLFPAAEILERPAIPPTLGMTLAEQEHEAKMADARERAERTGKPMEYDVRGRPIMPRWPLVSGVVPFLFTSGIPTRWLGLSIGFNAIGWLLLWALEMAMSGGMGAMAGMCFFVVGCVIGMIFASSLAAVLMQVTMESSMGNREVNQWPGVLDWFASLVYFGVAATLTRVSWMGAHVHSALGFAMGVDLTGNRRQRLDSLAPVVPLATAHQFALGNRFAADLWHTGALPVFMGDVLFRDFRACGDLWRGDLRVGQPRSERHSLADAATDRRVDSLGPPIGALGVGAEREGDRRERAARGGAAARCEELQPAAAFAPRYMKYRTAF